ncbi:YfhO family protein [Pontibacter sp. SGAir0037]|uniref:YfhO family protein n=1 Tax=Pontibacter sp. SGAir0037 TaxID=2571030 RepID=UPI0010CD3177|nr:YfhO family protein [Pontibacter sp. SGAir0037]QCR24273.1 hypothetical protein C1N53_19200 [Pontibacter sp. SGAir0037]
MASIDFKRNVLPHVVAVVIFLLLTAIYFSPVLFNGEGLPQQDIMQARGADKEIQDFRAATGEEPLWTNSMFSGMPAYLINTHYSGDWSGFIHKVLTLDMPALAGNIFITLLGAYILMLALGMNVWLSVVGAVAITFTSYNFIILEAGHNTKSLTIAYIPVVLGGLFYTLRRNMWIGAALFALGLTLNLHFNHLQMTYYMLLMILVFIVAEVVFAIRENRFAGLFKRGLLLLAGAILAAGVNFGRLYTTAEYSQYSIRGKSELSAPNSGAQTGTGLDREYAFQWSYGVSESMTLLIPHFYGGGSKVPLSTNSETYDAFVRMGLPAGQAEQIVKEGLPLYWGDQPFTSGPVYVGAIVCFLFILGLLIVDKRWSIWLVAATVLSLLLSWGHNFEAFNNLMFDYFPGYNKFRAVSSALVIAQITIPLLGMLALYTLLRDYKLIPNIDKKLLYAAGITGGLCLLVWLFAGTANFVGGSDQQLIQAQYPIDAIRADRESEMRSDALRSLILIVLAAGLLYVFLKNKVSALIAVAGVGILTLGDLWTVNKRYLNNDDFQKNPIANYFQPTQADQLILQDKYLSYRVINLPNPFQDARTSYYHKSVGGYHGAKLRRYQDLIEHHIAQNNIEVLRMLNTRYAITGNQQQPVQRVPGALGNAWFVQEVQAVNSPDEELAALSDFEAARTAVVDVEKFPVQQRSFSAENASIKLTDYQPNYLKYTYQAAQAGMVVFSEIYYPKGWQAYIDGQPVEHIRANYVLRAMQVPAGSHTIEFRFAPSSYETGNTVSLVSSILLMLVVIGAVVYGVKRGTKPDALDT